MESLNCDMEFLNCDLSLGIYVCMCVHIPLPVCAALKQYVVNDVNYDPLVITPDGWQERLDAALAVKRGTATQSSDGLTSYSIIAVPSFAGTSDWGAEPDAVLVRGVNRFENNFSGSATYILVLFMLAMVALDTLCLAAAIAVYLKPLEALGAYVRKGKTIDLDHLASLAKRKNIIYLIGFMGFLSPAVSIGLLFYERKNLREAFQDRSKGDPGVGSMTFKLKQNQMMLGFYGNSVNTAIKGLLAAPGDATLRATVKTILKGIRLMSVTAGHMHHRHAAASL